MLKNMQKYGGLYFLGALQLLLYGGDEYPVLRKNFLDNDWV